MEILCKNPTCTHPHENHFHYTFRLTNEMTACDVLEKINEVGTNRLKKIEQCISVVVGAEITESGVKHTHSYIISTLPNQTLRDRLKNAFNLSGNKSYSFKVVQCIQSALSYTIKCGDYVANGCFTKELLSTVPQWTFTNDSNDAFKIEKNKLIERYRKGLPDEDFLRQLIRLHATYDRNIYIGHIKAEFYKLAIKYNKRNIYEQLIMDSILNKF